MALLASISSAPANLLHHTYRTEKLCLMKTVLLHPGSHSIPNKPSGDRQYKHKHKHGYQHASRNVGEHVDHGS